MYHHQPLKNPYGSTTSPQVAHMRSELCRLSPVIISQRRDMKTHHFLSKCAVESEGIS